MQTGNRMTGEDLAAFSGHTSAADVVGEGIAGTSATGPEVSKHSGLPASVTDAARSSAIRVEVVEGVDDHNSGQSEVGAADVIPSSQQQQQQQQQSQQPQQQQQQRQPAIVAQSFSVAGSSASASHSPFAAATKAPYTSDSPTATVTPDLPPSTAGSATRTQAGFGSTHFHSAGSQARAAAQLSDAAITGQIPPPSATQPPPADPVQGAVRAGAVTAAYRMQDAGNANYELEKVPAGAPVV